MVIEKLTKPLGCITNFRSAWLHEIPSQKDKKKKVVFSNFFFLSTVFRTPVCTWHLSVQCDPFPVLSHLV